MSVAISMIWSRSAHRIEHHQLLQHPMRREFVGREVSKSEIADLLAGLRVLEKFQRGSLIELALIVFGLIRVAGFPVAEVGKSFETRRAGRHPLGAELLECQRVPGDVEQLVVALLLPILKSTMGTNGARVLANIYETAEHPRRREAADALIKLGPQAAAALPMLLADLAGTDAGRAHLSARVIGHLGPAAKNALPQLTLLLQQDSALIRVQAARVIWQLDHQTNVVLPVLLKELNNGSLGNGRRFAAEGLGDMGPAAAEAAPILKTLLSDARSDVRQAAAEALRKIDSARVD